MVNRDRHDIAIEILNKAVSGKRKTEIMRDVGLSYLQEKLYLGELENNGLLTIDEKHIIKTTKKGLEFLDRCADCPLFNWDKNRFRSLL